MRWQSNWSNWVWTNYLAYIYISTNEGKPQLNSKYIRATVFETKHVINDLFILEDLGTIKHPTHNVVTMPIIRIEKIRLHTSYCMMFEISWYILTKGGEKRECN